MAPRQATTHESEGEKYGSFRIEQTTNDEATLTIDMDDAIERLGMGKFQNDILLAAGLCFSADAMEVLLLSFLSTVLKDEWDLTEREENTIISMVFAGAMVGTLILSPLGDIVGRRPVFTFTAAAISIFGIATAFTQTYEWLLFTRFTVPVRANMFLVVVAVSRVFSCILVSFLYSLIH
jgi:MFS family permease